MVLASISWLPDAFIRLIPVTHHIFSPFNQDFLRSAIKASTMKCKLGCGIDYFPVYIKL